MVSPEKGDHLEGYLEHHLHLEDLLIGSTEGLKVGFSRQANLSMNVGMEMCGMCSREYPRYLSPSCAQSSPLFIFPSNPLPLSSPHRRKDRILGCERIGPFGCCQDRRSVEL